MALPTYEARLKRFVYQDSKISLSQLRSTFKNDKMWSKPLNDPTSEFFILLDGFFKLEENETEA